MKRGPMVPGVAMSDVGRVNCSAPTEMKNPSWG